tara:strand:+ start:194 stop:1315 length:1122 start_codon:yes stop_codon:yes gene_type:complete
MVKISSFISIKPNETLVKKIPTKSYNDYTEGEIVDEKKQNKFSFLNVIHNKIPDKKTSFRYIKKKINEFIDKNILIIEKNPLLFVYRQQYNENIYTGIICAVDIKEYKSGKIKKHEKTIYKREKLFADYISVTKIHAEPVLLTYNEDINLINTNHTKKKNLLFDFLSNDGVHHTVWRISNPKEINKIINLAKKIKSLYIADGHHRLASSSIRKEINGCLAYIIKKEQLEVFPFHRLVRSKYSYEEIIKKLKDFGEIKNIQKPKSTNKNLLFYINKKWHELNNKKFNNRDLFMNIIKSAFGILDDRNNKDLHFIPGNKKINEITSSIGVSDILFLMKGYDLEEIISTADQDNIIPPKSTYILPKIPSGLILMKL